MKVRRVARRRGVAFVGPEQVARFLESLTVLQCVASATSPKLGIAGKIEKNTELTAASTNANKKD